MTALSLVVLLQGDLSNQILSAAARAAHEPPEIFFSRPQCKGEEPWGVGLPSVWKAKKVFIACIQSTKKSQISGSATCFSEDMPKWGWPGCHSVGRTTGVFLGVQSSC